MIKKILVNSNTNSERMVEDLPVDYIFQDGETLEERDLTLEEIKSFSQPPADSYRISSFIPSSLKSVPVQFVNYKNQLDNSVIEAGGLVASRFFTKGELNKVVWYSDPEKTIPVVEVNITYIRTSSGIAKERVTDRYWYKNDGTKDLLKSTDKIYEGMDSIREWERRRKNALGSAKMTALGLSYYLFLGEEPRITEVRGNAYLANLQLEIANFIENGTQDLRDAIYNDVTTDWMNWEFSNHPVLMDAFPFKGTTKLKDVVATELDIWEELDLPLYLGQ